jgi:DNA-binding response OmpR family regulator
MQKFFLVIDPQEEEGRALATIARTCTPGAEAAWVPGAEAALDLLEEQRLVPSLVFCALGLPGMSGLEFLGELHRRRWLERTPVAIVSSTASDRQVVQAYRLGACTFLTRPLRAFEVREVVREFARPANTMRAASIVHPGVSGRTLSAA